MWAKFWAWLIGSEQIIGGPMVATTDPLMAAFNSAMVDVGQREAPMGSNGGAYVESLRAETGLTRKGGGEWCAVFVSAHLQRAGLPVGSRGAPGVVRALERLPGGRRVDPDEIEPGRAYVALRRRGLRTHHVQLFIAIETLGGLMVRHAGGNERNRVQTKLWSRAKFFRGVKKVVTYETPVQP